MYRVIVPWILRVCIHMTAKEKEKAEFSRSWPEEKRNILHDGNVTLYFVFRTCK